jgi:arabinoxylan arabinofuranohydrolase
MARSRFLFRLGLAVTAAMVTPDLAAQKLVTPGYLFNSDPTCRQIGDRFYLITTQDPFTVQFQRDNDFFRGMFAYHAFSTTDFDHWVDHGSILTARDINWNAGGALWDGDAAIPSNGRYFAYAPFRMNAASEANYGRFDIGVFTASRLGGPYRDAFDGPMRLPDGKPLEGLSPYVVKGDDGASFLMWGSGDTDKHEVWIARLKPGMTELAEAPRQLRVPKTDACGELEYFESPMLVKADGRWILTYVAYKDGKGPRCEAKGSYVRYTSAASMFGPFDAEAPRTLIYPSPGGHESTQQGMCTYKGRAYLAYHVPYDDVQPYADHHRQVAITRLIAAPGGAFVPVHPETDRGVGTPGVSVLALDAFASRREAAEFQVRTGATGEKGLLGEYQMKLKPGGYLLFKDMDFGAGAARFRAEISAETATLRDARLDVHLDNPQGPLVGSIVVRATGGRTDYRILSTTISPAARGKHHLALVATGSGGDADGHLFNITWFAFDPAGTKRDPASSGNNRP